jgi:hypothetical protein
VRQTHTYALLEVSPPVFNEIAQKLKAAGYEHAFTGKNEIDLNGIGLAPDPNAKAGDTSLTFTSILSQRTKQGLVQMRVNAEVAQMDLDKAREVRGLLDGAIEAAVSDQLVFTFLTTRIGLSPEAAGAALSDFRELRQGSRDVVIPS